MTTKQGQTVADAAMMLAGNAAALFSIAAENGVSVTASLSAETDLFFTGNLTAAERRIALLLLQEMPASEGNAGNWQIGEALVLQTTAQPAATGMQVEQGQTLADVAMMLAGDTAEMLQLAFANGLSITADLVPGDYFAFTGDLSASSKRVATLLSLPQNKPASHAAIAGTATVADLLQAVQQVVSPAGNKVQHGQCLVDLAMQYQGDAGYLYGLAVSLGLSPTALLTPGDYLEIAATPQGREKQVIKLLNEKQNIPASMVENERDKPEGIGYWYVWEYIVQ